MNDKIETDIQSEKIQAELKRCISRLSYIGMGLSPELDSSLVSLRKSIKSDESEVKIKKSIDQISKILRTMEDTPEPKSSQVNIAVKEADVIQELLNKKLPVKLRVALQQEQKIKKGQDTATLIINAIHSINNIIHFVIDILKISKRSR